jgi:uncharacterized protein (TIGR03437 family)
MVHQYLAPSLDTYWVQMMTGVTAAPGTRVTLSDSAPSSDPYNFSIVEVLAAPLVTNVQNGNATSTATPNATNRSNSAAPAASLVLAAITTGHAGEACSPSGLASLLGTQFTTGQIEKSSTSPLPTQLAGVQVKVNGTAAPLLLVSGKQINFQCPALSPGTALEIEVESANGSLISSLQTVMQAAAPLLFRSGAANGGLVTIAGTNQIAMAATDGIPSRPVKRGESLTVHSSGLGEVVDGVQPGTAAPLNRMVPIKNRVTLVLGDVEIDPEFAGLAPGTVGLYEVNAQVPVDAPQGSDVPLYLKITLPDGTIIRSNTVTIAVADATK